MNNNFSEKNIVVEKIGIDALVYGIYAALIPFNMIMNFTGSTINKQIGIISAGFMILYLFLKKRYRYLKNINWALAFFITYCIISTLWSVNLSVTLSSLVTLISLVLIYALGKMREFNVKEINIIILLMTIFSMIIPFYLGINLDISYSRMTLSNETGSADQNGLASNMAFVAILAFDFLFTTKNRLVKIFYAIATGLILIGIFLTGSRGALLGLFVATLFYLLKMFPDLRKNKTFWKAIVILIIGTVGIYFYLRNNLSDSIINRFSVSDVVASGGSGRLEVWANICKILLDNPLRAIFGYGFGTQKLVYGEVYGLQSASHNVFLQLLMDVGLVGVGAFVISFVYFWKWAAKKYSYVSSALWIVLLFTFLTLTFTTNKGAWNVFLMIYTMSLNQQNLHLKDDYVKQKFIVTK